LLIHAVFLGLLLCALFPGVFLHGELLVPGDILFDYPPWDSVQPEGIEARNQFYFLDALNAINKYYYLANRSLDQGEWPLWNDLEMGGLPLMANGQTALFYPPRLLHRALDPFVATTVYILLKLFLCGLSAFVCGRVLGLGVIGARIVSVGWMLCGYNVVWCHWPLPDISAWLPFLLASVELLLQRRYRAGFYGMATSATLLLLAGHPETAFSGSFWIGLYFLVRLIGQRFERQPMIKPMSVAAMAWCFAILVSAVQLLPLVEYISNSDRVRGGRWGHGFGYIAWSEVYGFWLPNYFENPGYDGLGILWVVWLFIGVTAWLGIATLILGGRRLDARVAGLGICTVLSGVSIVSNPLTDVLILPPVIGSMMQKYNLVFFLLGLLLMSGIGIDRWLSQRQSARRNVAFVGTVLVCCAIVFAYYWPMRPTLIINEMNATAVRQLLMFGATTVAGVGLLVLNSYWRSPKLIGFVLAIVLAAELILSLRPFHHSVPHEALFVDSDLTRYVQALEEPVRIDLNGSRVMWPGLLTYYGVETYDGYDGLYPKRTIRGFLGQEIYRETMSPVMGITHRLDRVDRKHDSSNQEESLVASATLLESMNGITVYRNDDSLPRAYLASELRVLADDDGLQVTMKNPEFDPSVTALTSDKPHTMPPVTAEPLGIVEIVDHTPNTVRMKVSAPAPCTLVLSENNYPGWRVTIDDEPAQLLTVFGCIRGVVVEEGSHTIEFKYDPTSFRAGLMVSTMTLLAGLAAGLYTGIRYKSR
jgi:hypothetical protein